MRKQLLVLALTLAAAPAMAGVVGSKHDLSTTGTATDKSNNITEVCVFCHTPHQAATANGQDPLWNHTLAGTATYGAYASTTFNGSITPLGGATAGTAAVSNLCLSCHDGSVGVGALYNDPAQGTPSNNATTISVTSANLGTDLSNDHPVNFVYNAALVTSDQGSALSPGLADPASAAVADLLFATTVQCASCHDPHSTTNAPFLVKSNTNSALCTTCHLK